MKHHLANERSKVVAETTAQLVWILAQRLPEPGGMDQDPLNKTVLGDWCETSVLTG